MAPETNPLPPQEERFSRPVALFLGLWMVGVVAVGTHLATSGRSAKGNPRRDGFRPVAPQSTGALAPRGDSTGMVISERPLSATAAAIEAPAAPATPAPSYQPRPSETPAAIEASVLPARTFTRLTQGLTASPSAGSSAAAWSRPEPRSGLAMFVDSNRAEVMRAKNAQQQALQGGRASAEQISVAGTAQAATYNAGSAAETAGIAPATALGGGGRADGGPGFGPAPRERGDTGPGANPDVDEKRTTYKPDPETRRPDTNQPSPSGLGGGAGDDKDKKKKASEGAGEDCRRLAALNAPAPANASSATPRRTSDGVAVCRQHMAAAMHDKYMRGQTSQAEYDACMATCGPAPQ